MPESEEQQRLAEALAKERDILDAFAASHFFLNRNLKLVYRCECQNPESTCSSLRHHPDLDVVLHEMQAGCLKCLPGQATAQGLLRMGGKVRRNLSSSLAFPATEGTPGDPAANDGLWGLVVASAVLAPVALLVLLGSSLPAYGLWLWNQRHNEWT